MKTRLVPALLVVLAVSLFFPLQSAQAAKKKKAKDKEAPPAAEVQKKAPKEAQAKRAPAPKPAAEAKPAPQIETAATAFPPAELTVGFQARDSETEGLGDLLIPVWNPGGQGLLFVNPRASFTDDDAEEANLGLGYRQLLPKQKLIIGGNVYYDYRDTGEYNYDQWGFGVELLSPWIDARANYYDPDDDKNVVASQTETTTRQSVSSSASWRDPYAEDHYILQDYVVTRTVTTTTSTKTYEQFEQALGGYDWEIGLRLPLPVKAEKLEARIFGGYYDFDNDLGANVDGWKARAELRLAASLFLDAGVYEDDQLTGSDWFAGARLSVPLDLAAIAKGRNPFATAKSRLDGAPRDFSARLTEMVMRDPQIRLEQSKFIENKALAEENSASSRSSSRQTALLLSDVQFVDGDVPVSGNGTAEFPFSTIQQGANAVYGSRNVYVYNASGPYSENVVLLPDTTLWGSGVLVEGFDGKTFGSGIAPVVDGMSMGPSITVADRTTVKGFTVQNTEMGGPDQFVLIPGMPTYNTRRVGIYGMNATDFTIDRNTLSGNEVGALFAAEENDLNFLFTDSLATGNDIGAEVLATGGGGGFFFADFQNSSFYRNVGSGLLLISQEYLESIARFNNGNVSDNAIGLQFIQGGNMLAMSLVSGAQADNNVIGLQTVQGGNLFGLVNISDSEANANVAFGIQNVQYSQIASIGIIGMPAGMMDSANAAASLLGLTLPEEVGLFLSPSGPITANGNGVFGVQSVVQTDSGLALGGLFDIAANGNGVFGVQSVVTADSGLALGALFDITANGNGVDGINAVNTAAHGVAIGLAGSTENLGDIVQMGTEVASLFGLDLPLAITSQGHMEANGNGGVGFSMTTTGSNAAINAVVGLDTLGNGNAGTFLGTYSDNLSIAALARLYTAENLGAGLLFDVYGLNTGAIGVLADVFADVNGDSGITASVDSPNGFAALLALSTDALRPAAALLGEMFLGAPYTLPGEPFGPVVASGNVGNGFTANVTGNDFALAAILDTQADGNSGNGFDVQVGSANGMGIAAFISSDLAYDLLSDLIGGDPIPDAGLGPVSASNNGGTGFAINVGANDEAVLVMAGAQASGNLAGSGIQAALTSTNSGALAVLVNTFADGNAGRGIDLNLAGLGDVLAGLVYAGADANGLQGIRILGNSTGADAYALLAGVDADGNGSLGGQPGLLVDLTAASDIAVALTDFYARNNSGRGANVLLDAGGNAALFGGDLAADDLDLLYGFSSTIGPLFDLIPRGSADFSGNGSGGLHAELTSANGTAMVGIDGATANNNVNMGFNLTLNALNGVAMADLLRMEASGNGGNGVNLSLNGAGTLATAWLDDVTTIDNGANGIQVTETFNGIVPAYVGGQYLVSQNNTGNGVRLAMSGLGGAPILDFGGGGDSAGQSSIFGNGNRDFRYNDGGGATVMAQNNWWGQDPPVAGQFAPAASIDRSNWLTSDPNMP